MKNQTTTLALLLAAALAPAHVRAEFLYSSFLVPSFYGGNSTEYSEWDVFYAPNGGLNYPDIAAPNGIYQSASSAGFSNPGDWSPSNPFAFWHTANPSIQQTNGGHFIIGPGTAGNIYGFVTGNYVLADSTSYTLGTVVFQFQTEGNRVDFSSIKLRYNSGNGVVELAPAEFLREYRSTSSSFGGIGNRLALQWDLTGLGVTSYEILWNSSSSSMSLQQAVLDTAATHAPVVPARRTWTTSGSQLWSAASNWAEGSTSIPNGNVFFQQTGSAHITLDGNRTVGEVFFDSAGNTTISGSSELLAHTGITATANATGTHNIQTPWQLGAFNLMDIRAGEVRLEGVVSGAYGMLKTGNGTLVLANNNTFGNSTTGLGVQGGTLRIEGTNTYGGSTSVLWGTLEVATDAPVSSNGAFGNASSAVIVGASSTTFSSITEPAQVVIDGDHTIARNLTIEQGTFEKRLGARNTTTEAVFSGNISLLGSGANATSVKLFAEGPGDTVRFTGNLSGGATGSHVRVNADGEQGTVIFAGANKTYTNSTAIHAGTLVITSGTSTTGAGDWTVHSGAALRVDGILGGAGSFTLSSNATLAGSGTLNKNLSVGGGALLSPGNSPGTLSTGSQTWAGGGSYLWEINDADAGAGTDPGWDLLSIVGTLTITATALDPFIIQLHTLTPGNIAGLLHDFSDSASYSWTIATTTGGVSGFSASAFSLDTSAFQNSFTGDFSLAVSGNDLVLQYTPIPEPGTAALASLALLAWLAKAARRRRAPAAGNLPSRQPKTGNML